MKKNIILNFTRILLGLFIVGTIISLFIAYKNIDSRSVFIFLMGYLVLTIFLLIYIPIITLLNLRKLNRVEIRRRILKFFALFVLFSALNYGLNYFFRPSSIDLVKVFTNSLGLSFGISFIDIIILKIKDKSSDRAW